MFLEYMNSIYIKMLNIAYRCKYSEKRKLLSARSIR